MNNAIIIDFTAYRKKRLNNEPLTQPVSEDLITEIKKLIERLKTKDILNIRNPQVLPFP